MRSEMETIITRAALYNLWNMVPWFIIKQTQTETVKLITSRPPTVLLDNGFMIHNQTNTNGNDNDHLTYQLPYSLLENGSMVHNQTNMNGNGNDHLTCRPTDSFVGEWFHGS